jgi:tRNA G18 (ribose-2'-O)-methylase SpoU
VTRIVVTTADDPRLADYVRLRETSLRRSLESRHGLFIAEGEKVIRRAVEAGYVPRSFLLAERWLPGLADVLERWPQVPTYVVSEALAEEVTGFHVHRGALASLHRVERYAVADLLGACRLVVIEDVVDHTNVGAIIRCAAGLGWDGVLLAPRAADPLYRRSIKVSMGAVFTMPWARLADWATAPSLLHGAGLQTVALTLADEAVDLAAFASEVRAEPRRLAIMLGTEGAGLSARWTEAADVRVKIAMHGGIDSLNVAAAAAIACYALEPTTGQNLSTP